MDATGSPGHAQHPLCFLWPSSDWIFQNRLAARGAKGSIRGLGRAWPP